LGLAVALGLAVRPTAGDVAGVEGLLFTDRVRGGMNLKVPSLCAASRAAVSPLNVGNTPRSVRGASDHRGFAADR